MQMQTPPANTLRKRCSSSSSSSSSSYMSSLAPPSPSSSSPLTSFQTPPPITENFWNCNGIARSTLVYPIRYMSCCIVAQHHNCNCRRPQEFTRWPLAASRAHTLRFWRPLQQRYRIPVHFDPPSQALQPPPPPPPVELYVDDGSEGGEEGGGAWDGTWVFPR